MPLNPKKITKYTGIYQCPDDIRNFKLRIKYALVDAENEDDNDDTEILWQSKLISWQEKHFNKSEIEFYGNVLNCVTDFEKRCHEQVKAQDEIENGLNIFTYIDEDAYKVDELLNYNKPSYLQKLVENSNAVEETEVNCEEHKGDIFDYNKYLQSSVENKIIPYNVEKMYIMADLGEYVENMWIKNEQIIANLRFDKSSRVLSIYPDFTKRKPYNIKLIHSDTVRYFFYFIKNCSEASKDVVLKEKKLSKKTNDNTRNLRQRIIGNRFPLPPKNRLYVYLFFEILSAKKFEYPRIYVQYYIDLPEGWSCEQTETLTGKTQTCHSTTDESLLHFGQCFDVVLQYDIQKLNQGGIPKAPYIYFEIISKGSWDRYRTEGLTYKNLPISEPGPHFYNLSCFRFTQGVAGNLRRFFIGDCTSYKDITWIGMPKEYQETVINKSGINTLGTGELNIRLNVVHQSQAFLKEFNEGDPREKFIYEKLNSSSLIKSVEEVLQAFRKARKNMYEVRKDL